MKAARVTVCLLLAAAGLALQPAQAGADLVSAWRSAQAHDPAFAAARAEWDAGQTRQRQGRALWRPSVAVTGSASYLNSDRDTRGAQFSAPGFGAADNAQFRSKISDGQATNLGVIARQPLYSAALDAEASRLERQAQLAEVRFRGARQELALRAAQAYFGVLLSGDTLATLQAQKQAAAMALEAAIERFEAGATPVTDRDEARARFDEITAQELLAANDLQLKRRVLSDLSGTPSDQIKPLDPKAPLERFGVGALADWSERASRQNPLIAMQELGREIARDEVAKYRALVSPSLDLVAQVSDDRMRGANGFGTSLITGTSSTVGVQLTIPLYTGGMRSARRDEAVALAEKARYDAEALRQEILRQTQAAWLEVSTGTAQLRAREQSLQSARSRLTATEIGQEVGARTMLDLVNAQADFYRAGLGLAQAKYQFLLGRLRLAAVAGELSEDELQMVNAVLSQ
jgi:outer membrane protein